MRKRLIGPTVITLILSALFADYLLMGGSPWSVVRFLGKFVAALGMILYPVVDPVLYSWIDKIIIPVLLIALVVLLLFLSIAKAKRAMIQATPNAEASAPGPAARAPEPRAPLELLGPTLAVPAGGRRRSHTMLARCAYRFAAVGLLFGFVACLVVFSFLSLAMERKSKDRVGVMAMGLAEIVAPTLGFGDIDAAAGAVEKFAATNSIAYLYLEDAQGRVIAHWPRDLPRFLRRDFPASTERVLRGADGEYQGEDTYEIARRIGDGKLGFVHLAIWRQTIRAEVFRLAAAIAAMTSIVIVCSLGALILLAQSLLRPLAELVEQASRLSRDEFNLALDLQRSDEFGDIARCLERLRSSLRAVMTRLDTGRPAQRPADLHRSLRPTRKG